ncbi:MAG: hypothetical protein LBT59_10345 [Clostridiales bacterium]|jgi:hypothetical protein|nr:hypothetical protein [Clostridiales bacterium]
MKRLAIALILLTGLAFGIQQSYSWFSSRDEAQSVSAEGGNLDVRLSSDHASTEIFFPGGEQIGETYTPFHIGYRVNNYSKVPTIVRVNHAGVHYQDHEKTLLYETNKNSPQDTYTFRLYKLTDKCFKFLNHLGKTEKYVDYEYLDSIGFVPYDISSPNYEVVPLIFSEYVKKEKSLRGFYTTNPDIGLHLIVNFAFSSLDCKLAPGYSSRGYCYDEQAPGFSPVNNMYIYLPAPPVPTHDNKTPSSHVDVNFAFSLPITKSSEATLKEDPTITANFDNSFQYSVVTLDVNQDSLLDEFGYNYLGDLKAVAIENNVGAFRSVFNNYADEELFYKLQPSNLSGTPTAAPTPLPTPVCKAFSMTVKQSGTQGEKETKYEGLGAKPDDYLVISCADYSKTVFEIDELDRFDVETASPHSHIEQNVKSITVELSGQEEPGTVAVIQLLMKESRTVMLTIKVVKEEPASDGV